MAEFAQFTALKGTEQDFSAYPDDAGNKRSFPRSTCPISILRGRS